MRPNYSIENIETAWEEFDLIQQKFDGMFVSVHVSARTCEIKTRTGKVLHSLKLSNFHKSTVFVGEWMRGTQRSQKWNGEIVVHDVQSVNGWDCSSRPYLQRLEELKGVQLPVELNEFLNGNAKAAVLFPETWNRGFKNALWANVESGEWEGLILRSSTKIFGFTVGKCKKEAEGDFFAVRLHEKDGRAVSIIGSMFPGGPEVVRARIYDKTEAVEGFEVGRVFCATGSDKTKKGSLRNPMFSNWHLEK